MVVNEAAAWLLERDDFLILTHVRPDGDTLGSAAALCNILREAGKKAGVLYNPQITKRYASYMEPYWVHSTDRQYLLSADIATEDLFPMGAEDMKGQVDLAIDHHPSNTGFAKHTLLDASCGACGEILYDLALAINGQISQETATLVYIAVTTDTGCFRYGNTTPRTHRVAALTVEAGAPGPALNKKFFRTKTRARVGMEMDILNNLSYTHDGAVATVVVTQEMIRRNGADEDDLEDIASIHGQIQGVVISITIREQLDGRAKISVRTNGQADANRICAALGGGGHMMAAGAMARCDVWEAKKQILASVDENGPWA